MWVEEDLVSLEEVLAGVVDDERELHLLLCHSVLQCIGLSRERVCESLLEVSQNFGLHNLLLLQDRLHGGLVPVELSDGRVLHRQAVFEFNRITERQLNGQLHGLDHGKRLIGTALQAHQVPESHVLRQ